MTNRILQIAPGSIPFVKELMPYAGSITACLLMQQLDYWFEKKPDGFYKFLEPAPGKPTYRQGDSWTEELAMSAEEFRTAFDRIGFRHKSKGQFDRDDDKFHGKFYCSYVDRRSGLTWYSRNHKEMDEVLERLEGQVLFAGKDGERKQRAAIRNSKFIGIEQSPVPNLGKADLQGGDDVHFGIPKTTIVSTTIQTPLSTPRSPEPEYLPEQVSGSRNKKIELLTIAEKDRSLVEFIIRQHRLTDDAAQDLADEFCQRRIDTAENGARPIQNVKPWLNSLARKAARGEPILDRGRIVKEKREAEGRQVLEAEKKRAVEAGDSARWNTSREEFLERLRVASKTEREHISQLAMKHLVLTKHGSAVVAAIENGDLSSLSPLMQCAVMCAIEEWSKEVAESEHLYVSDRTNEACIGHVAKLPNHQRVSNEL